MTYTCAEAAKLLRSLNEELSVLRGREQKSYRFTASIDEDIESARPEYDYKEEQKKLYREYLDAFRANLKAQLDAIEIVDDTETVAKETIEEVDEDGNTVVEETIEITKK